jgi:uncharacterized Zn finger protein
MSQRGVVQPCPQCGSLEVPTLVVRGSNGPEGGVSLRCRDCGAEWTNEGTDQVRAS